MGSRYAFLTLLVVAALGTGFVLLSQLTESDTESSRRPDALAEFSLLARPQQDRHLFDYAGVLRHYEEGAQVYLNRMAARYHIEAAIVSVPSMPSGHSLSTLAVDILNRWKIGADQDGRGLLLLLVEDTHEVKLEVAYALEHVFTDAFTGIVEHVQLGPYYRNGDVGTGLIAVMELLEERAQLTNQGEYTLAQVAQADARLLSGGAGAARRLAHEQTHEAANPGASERGSESPEAAWRTMLAQWDGRGEGTEADIYTAMTRRAMGDPNHPDPRTTRSLSRWQTAEFKVLSDSDHAVIWFGAREGWENAPFLFCNTGAGWKFDIVHQRRLVIMAEAPRWQISQGPYPYAALMPEAQQATSKDLPLDGDDLYRCRDDVAIDARMRELEAVLASDPNMVDAILELLKLNVVTGQRPNLVMPLIDRARQLAPYAPDAFKYAAIYHINTFFQYETALEEIERYLNLQPEDSFAYRMKGFLLYRLGRYAESIRELEVAASLQPQDGYAYGLMSRDYALLARRARGAEKRGFENQARSMRDKAANAAMGNRQRLAWLDRWLAARLG